jgi:MoCo/4Fe-4S cofactor protein with predicted Tat translocation signal
MSESTLPSPAIDLDAIRARLSATGNEEYWRSLEQLAETPEFLEFLHREFPRQAADWDESFGRRGFLKLMAASLSLAGATGCLLRQPEEKIVPYVRQPEGIVPGDELFYATATTLGGYAQGILVGSRMGRPIKVEGNPEHPASLGATDIFAQASVLSLYDPDRSKTVVFRGNIETWDHFLRELAGEMPNIVSSNGQGLAILTETVTSPTLAGQLDALLQKLPRAKWHQYQPIGRDNAREGARLALGRPVDTIYDFSRAETILSFDADFLFGMPGSLRYARQFADARRSAIAGAPDGSRMSRLYAIESTPTLTGSMADHRWPLKARDIERVARLLAADLGEQVAEPGGGLPAGLPTAAFDAISDDLETFQSRSLVIAGDSQPPEVHALVHACNRALGKIGTTVRYVEPVEARPVDHLASLGELVDDLKAGRVRVLLIVGGNPVYNTPAELDFAGQLRRSLGLDSESPESPLRLCVHLSDYYNETSLLAHWHIPAAHELESWSDARAFDGTATILQPLIAPLYDGKTAHELISVVAGDSSRPAYDIVREHWQKQWKDDFESTWRHAVHNGVVPGTQAPAVETNWVFRDRLSSAARTPASDNKSKTVELVFRPDPTIWDGRFSNSSWLQELPKPLTKLTWDNAALVSPETAKNLNVSAQDVIRLKLGERTVEAAVWLLPGQPDDSIALTLGYGRTHAGRVGNAYGYNAYRLLPAQKEWFASDATVERTGETYPLVSTHEHWSMEGRELVRTVAWSKFAAESTHVEHEAEEEREQPNFYPPYPYPPKVDDIPQYAWGMTIDQTSCIGCNACIVACQAENNTPVVGKQQVAKGREMHWLRVDRYYKGTIENPETYFQPVPCMHCEQAPCEVVCPVAATVHDTEGINNMVYNRCVGTRYCSNNCPYKVRRFNFLNFTDIESSTLKLLQNPQVTVRSRGVMEKCTYCVQRIDAARIDAKQEGRAIRDGEVQTACQSACPTRAISFGNLNDAQSQVRKEKASPLNYALLGELNTVPRTTYLARVRHANPDLGAIEPQPDVPQALAPPAEGRTGGSA